MTKLCLAVAVLCVLGSCTDPITVGSELLDDDRATVGQTTDIPFTTRVVREDSARTLEGVRPVGPDGYTFGRLEDMTFGVTDHSIYLVPQPQRNAATGLTIVPNFVQQPFVRVDSVVLLLPIDTLKAFYGPGRSFPFSLRELSERVASDAVFYSDTTLSTTGGNLAEQDVFTATAEPTVVRDTFLLDSALLRAHVRIRMAQSFVDRSNALEVSDFVSDSIFRETLPGLALLPEGNANALISLLPPQQQSELFYRGLNYYYTDTSGTQRVDRIGFRQVIPSYQTDYTGSLVGELLNQEVANDLVAVAGEGGVATELTLTGLNSLAGRIINRAVLEIPVAELPGVNYDDFDLPGRVELFYRAGGVFVPITDRVELLRSQTRVDGVNLFIGGPLREEGGLRFYDPAFSIHLQRMIDGDVPPRLYLRVTPLLNNEPRAARALLNGPAATDRPARIRVTFTDVN